MKAWYYIPHDPYLLWGFIIGAWVFSIAGFFGLQLLPTRARRPLVVGVTFVAGLIFALEFFLPTGIVKVGSIRLVQPENKNFLSPALEPIRNLVQIVVGLSLGLGVFSLLRLHTRNLLQRRVGWYNSLVLILCLVAMAVLAAWHQFGEKDIVQPPKWVENSYEILFTYTWSPLDATMFSMVAFYIFSAAYRAFRIRSIESSVLMFTAMIVMVGSVPFAYWLSESLHVPQEGFWQFLRLEIAKDWILKQLNAPAIRAIEFGVGIGGLAMALRLWLSLERGLGVGR